MNGVVDKVRAIAGNRLALVIAGILLLAGVFTAGIVWSSLDHVEQRRAYRSAINQAARLSAQNAGLMRENADLKARIAKIERQLQVNRIAYDNLTAQLKESTGYVNELREDVDFYQSILSPRDNEAGVKVQGWQVAPLDSGAGFHYKLTVVQALNHDKSVTGETTIYIDGTRGGSMIRLSLRDIGDPPASLDFRYFQVVQGRFTLPEAFQPLATVVKIVSSPAGKGRKTEVERKFEWSVRG
ncbi:MAG: hypothetical protein DWQ08_11125 [Proteobacteria bacterium]|nr:MAG: hypothetical protein DWQ08_11125 [Pseudomonadota bacterium]